MTTFNNMGLTWPDIGSATYAAETEAAVQKIDEHTHEAGKGLQIPAGGLASDSVTTVKILNSNVTTPKIADLNVTLGKLAVAVQDRLANVKLVELVATLPLSGSTTSTTPTEVNNAVSPFDSQPLSFTGLKTGDVVEVELSSAAGIGSGTLTAEGVNVAVIAGIWGLKDQADLVFAVCEVASQSTAGSATTDPKVSVPCGGFKIILQIPSDGNYAFRLVHSVYPALVGTVYTTAVQLVGKVWRNVAP